MNLVKRNSAIDFFPTFNHLFDDVLGTEFKSHKMDFEKTLPAVNVKESDTNFVLEMAIPGFNKEDFKVDLDNNVLTISSEVEQKNETKETEKITRKEFSYSTFKRSFKLPKNVDKEAISAKYENGILNLELPKAQPKESEKRLIKIG